MYVQRSRVFDSSSAVSKIFSYEPKQRQVSDRSDGQTTANQFGTCTRFIVVTRNFFFDTCSQPTCKKATTPPVVCYELVEKSKEKCIKSDIYTYIFFFLQTLHTPLVNGGGHMCPLLADDALLITLQFFRSCVRRNPFPRFPTTVFWTSCVINHRCRDYFSRRNGSITILPSQKVAMTGFPLNAALARSVLLTILLLCNTKVLMVVYGHYEITILMTRAVSGERAKRACPWQKF